jgi:hypothetical protein
MKNNGKDRLLLALSKDEAEALEKVMIRATIVDADDPVLHGIALALRLAMQKKFKTKPKGGNRPGLAGIQ